MANSSTASFIANIKAQLDLSGIDTQLKKIENKTVNLKNVKISNFTLDTSKLPSTLQATLDKHKFTITIGNINTSNLARAAQNVGRTMADTIRQQIDNGGIEASIAKIEQQYEKLGTTGHARLYLISEDIKKLRQEQNDLANSANDTHLISNYQKFSDTLAQVKNNMSIVSSESKRFVTTLQIQTLDNKIKQWMEQNTAAASTYGGQLTTLRSQLAQFNATGGTTASQLEAVNLEFKELTTSAALAGKTGQTVGSIFQNALSRLTSYFSASTLIFQTIRALKEMANSVLEIDTEMTELKKVTDETAASYEEFLDSASSSAKEIGTTISGLVSSTADFARLGYSFEDSQELAEVANIYAVVGDEIEDVDQATESIISTMAAFDVEVEDAITIVDKFNEVGKRLPKHIAICGDIPC